EFFKCLNRLRMTDDQNRVGGMPRAELIDKARYIAPWDSLQWDVQGLRDMLPGLFGASFLTGVDHLDASIP
ncbi:MAG: hypothetical protein OEU26_35295, partial [Candidatus Tectomicrobia bacterium]|nr:hypothetical protein [Candidatus Tectomicrobia bacterium]